MHPYLIALTSDERHLLPKMSDKTQPFVEKALDYCETVPDFAPPYKNIEGLQNDMKVHGQLTPIWRMVRMFIDSLDDTVMQAGAESYVSALTYYNSVKMAARMDVPGAKSTYDDLKKRFVKEKSEDDENGE